jgi:hypothetical protein
MLGFNLCNRRNLRMDFDFQASPIPPRGAAAVTALVNLSGSAGMAQTVATAPIHYLL